ncbi:MAG: tRNA lysidine(34) synthetase TilS [Clostridiaceae bacterium]
MLSEKVLDYIKRNGLIEEDDRILIAFSGGADSLALLYILDELKDKLGITIGACHLNHMLRGEEAREDESFCREIAESLAIPFYSKSEDARAYSEANGVSIEVAGRELRYAFFKEIMVKERYGKCAVAHHMNDQAETILLNLLRGTGLNGLSGISAKRDEFIRPLLFLSKKEILVYLKERNLRAREDLSNEENIYQRNKIRNEMIPYIEKNFNPDFVRTLARMADTLTEDMDFIDMEVRKAKEKYLILEVEANQKGQDENPVVLSATIQKEAFDLHKAVAKRLVMEAIRTIKKNLMDIEEVHIKDILKLQEGETGKTIDIKESITAYQDYGNIIIKIKKKRKEKELMEEIKIPGEYMIEGQKITLRIVGKDDIIKDKHLRYLNGDIMEESIVVRHRVDGDRMRPLGMKGYKKLKNILIDKKVSQEKRDELLIFLNKNEVIYVGTMIISDDYKVKANTEKIVEIGLFGEETND